MKKKKDFLDCKKIKKIYSTRKKERKIERKENSNCPGNEKDLTKEVLNKT